MSVNQKPIFNSQFSLTRCHLTAAYDSGDTSTIIVLVDNTTGAPLEDALGLQVDNVHLAAPGPTTAGRVILFTYDGSSWAYLGHFGINAVTSDAIADGTPPFEADWSLTETVPLMIPHGWKLGASPTNDEEFWLHASLGKYTA